VNEILLDYVTFFTLFSCVSVKNIVHLFSNALLERRIILVAENLSTLSSCVMAASNLLQPFHWQHVYIPVLPLVLMDYCFAETVQLLTDRGWASMAEVARRWQTFGEKSEIRIAAYDADTCQTVFQKPSRVILNAAKRQRMIRFGGVMVTPEHAMWTLSENGWRKERADALVGTWAAMAFSEKMDNISPTVGGNGEAGESSVFSPTVFVKRVRGEWEERYEGATWCVTVPSGLVWCREQNSNIPPMVCGNCTAPMPFFVGVLKSCLPLLERMPLEEVLVLDIENDRFLLDPQFEEALPQPEMKRLIKTLSSIALAPDRESDLRIASVFYQFFHDIFSGMSHLSLLLFFFFFLIFP
jgi:hypothetical protein